jgi:hypothetical protein
METCKGLQGGGQSAIDTSDVRQEFLAVRTPANQISELLREPIID